MLRKIFCAFINLLTITLSLETILLLAGQSDRILFLSLLLFSFLSLIVNSLALRKEREKLYIAVNLSISFIALLVLFVLTENSYAYYIASFTLYICYSFYSLFLLSSEKDASRTKVLDVSFLVFLFSVIYIYFYGGGYESTYPSLCAIVLALLSIVIDKAFEDGKTAFVSILFFALAFIISFLIASRNATGVSVVFSAIVHFISWLKDGLNAIILFILSLFPRFGFEVGTDFVYFDTAPSSAHRVVITTLDEKLFIILMIFFLLLSALAFVIIMIRLIRPNGKRKNSTDVKITSTKSFMTLIKQTLKDLKTWAWEILYIEKNRNNINGLYFWIERKVRRTKYAKKEGESVFRFLTRLSYPTIALTYDEFFYSEVQQQLSKDDAKIIRKNILKLTRKEKIEKIRKAFLALRSS